LSRNRFGASRLWLRGERDGLAFEATLSSLEFDYNWRMLLNGQLQSVVLSNLDIAVEKITASTEPPASTISVENLLPQPLIAQLPLQSLEIKKWKLEYRSPGLPLIAATGSLLIEEQLNLHLETSHLGIPVARVAVDSCNGQFTDRGAAEPAFGNKPPGQPYHCRFMDG
jgi:hypothetical protein